MNNQLSVIIPVYNTEEYLRQCLDSILAQDYEPCEIILVDDGSTDGSGAVCDAYAAADARIKVIHQTNMGHTAARQNGFNASTGDHIIMIDSDDWIEPGMFSCMMEKALADDADIVQCSPLPVKENGEIDERNVFQEGLYDKQRLEHELYPKMIYSGSFYAFGIAPNMWNKIWKRRFVQTYLFQIDRRIRSGEDGLFTYMCFKEAERIWILNTSFYHYRSRAASMCHIMNDKRLEENHILFLCYDKWFYDQSVFQSQLEHYAVYETLQAMGALLKTKTMKTIMRENSFIKEDCLERRGIRNVRVTEVTGKRNKLVMRILKMWLRV